MPSSASPRISRNHRYRRNRSLAASSVGEPLETESLTHRGIFMPVVGSSAYNTAGQITSLVRSLLNDAQGNLFTDAVLLPYVNSAYRKLQRALGNAGGGGFLTENVTLIVPAVT